MRKISVFAFAMIFAACQSQSGENGSFGIYTADCEDVCYDEEMPVMASAKAAPMMRNSMATGGQLEAAIEQNVTERKLIKNGSMTLVVDNLEQTRSEVLNLIEKHGGYVSNEQYSSWEHSSAYNLTVRIPCGNFDSFVADVEAGKGKIESKSMYINDVTAEYIDLETRLDTKRSYLKRYKELLKSAKSVQEIVSIEDKIRSLEEEIDSTVGQLKYLSNQVDYSTLHLNIRHDDANYDPHHPEHNQSVAQRLWQSLRSGFRGLVDFVFFLVRIWPAWVIILLVLGVIRRAKRKNED
ncbi:MAG: DUF4349 domain-containing protein [Salinivirgaceae bacterium]|nr:DUF4349 domain-containing protein [Salinivirgaceae bacterium]